MLSLEGGEKGFVERPILFHLLQVKQEISAELAELSKFSLA